MDGEGARQFGWYLLFWLAYFTIIYSSLMFVYLRLRRKQSGAATDRSASDSRAALEERDRLLRRRLVRIGFALMAAPLLLPILLRLIG